MTEAFSLPLEADAIEPAPAALTLAPVDSPRVGNTVEIIAPDQHCADLLVAGAAGVFSPEIVPGSGWVIRFHAPAGGEWVLDFLSLIERWMEAIPIPCTKVFYGDRSYLIRAGAGVAPSDSAEPMLH